MSFPGITDFEALLRKDDKYLSTILDTLCKLKEAGLISLTQEYYNMYQSIIRSYKETQSITHKKRQAVIKMGGVTKHYPMLRAVFRVCENIK